MIVDGAMLAVLAVIFLATLIRSAFGFGEALIAVPLLAALHIPIDVAAPLAVLLSITVALVAVAQDWHHIHIRSAGSGSGPPYWSSRCRDESGRTAHSCSLAYASDAARIGWATCSSTGGVPNE